jgi:RNA polymerase sigma-70 factor, ECF subfamily
MSTAQPVSDVELMDEVSAGSRDALTELYDRYCHRAYGVALSMCGDEGCAQDTVEEAFLSIWKTGATYASQRGTVAAWLLTVVHGRARESVIQHDNAAHRCRSLDKLSDEEREVITLARYGGLSHTEIATQLGLPSATVKGRMRLGLHKLRAGTEQAAA